jgi:hypothetical protein
MNARTPALTAALLALALGATACAGARLPGTDIRSTPETRGVFDTLGAYRDALEKRDAGAVLALVAPDYYDPAGTPEPGDDLDRAGLELQLTKDLAALESIKVSMTLRRIDLDAERAGAQAEVFFEQYYKVHTPSGLVPRRDADVQRFRLKRVGERWLFVSGL